MDNHIFYWYTIGEIHLINVSAHGLINEVYQSTANLSIGIWFVYWACVSILNKWKEIIGCNNERDDFLRKFALIFFINFSNLYSTTIARNLAIWLADLPLSIRVQTTELASTCHVILKWVKFSAIKGFRWVRVGRGHFRNFGVEVCRWDPETLSLH